MSLEIPTVYVKNDQLQIQGELVFATVSNLLETGNSLLSQLGDNDIALNMQAVKRVDSAGLALLIEWHRFSLKLNKTVCLKNVPKQALSLIETYKLNTFFRINSSS